MEQEQRLYVHNSRTIQDDGETAKEVTLSTRGETPPTAHEELYEAVYNQGVDPADLHKHEDKNIATVQFDPDGNIKQVDLDDWVIEEYTQ